MLFTVGVNLLLILLLMMLFLMLTFDVLLFFESIDSFSVSNDDGESQCLFIIRLFLFLKLEITFIFFGRISFFNMEPFLTLRFEKEQRLAFCAFCFNSNNLFLSFSFLLAAELVKRCCKVHNTMW